MCDEYNFILDSEISLEEFLNQEFEDQVVEPEETELSSEKKNYCFHLLFEHQKWNYAPYTFLDYYNNYGVTGYLKNWCVFFHEVGNRCGYKFALSKECKIEKYEINDFCNGLDDEFCEDGHKVGVAYTSMECLIFTIKNVMKNHKLLNFDFENCQKIVLVLALLLGFKEMDFTSISKEMKVFHETKDHSLSKMEENGVYYIKCSLHKDCKFEKN
jgi:hypothetical protein